LIYEKFGVPEEVDPASIADIEESEPLESAAEKAMRKTAGAGLTEAEQEQLNGREEIESREREERIKEIAADVLQQRLDGIVPRDQLDNMLYAEDITPSTDQAAAYMERWDKEQAERIYKQGLEKFDEQINALKAEVKKLSAQFKKEAGYKESRVQGALMAREEQIARLEAGRRKFAFSQSAEAPQSYVDEQLAALEVEDENVKTLRSKDSYQYRKGMVYEGKDNEGKDAKGLIIDLDPNTQEIKIDTSRTEALEEGRPREPEPAEEETEEDEAEVEEKMVFEKGDEIVFVDQGVEKRAIVVNPDDGSGMIELQDIDASGNATNQYKYRAEDLLSQANLQHTSAEERTQGEVVPLPKQQKSKKGNAFTRWVRSLLPGKSSGKEQPKADDDQSSKAA